METVSPKNLELAAIEIEKAVSTYIGNEAKACAERFGIKVALDLELTVATLYMGRVIATQHIRSGEALKPLVQRMLDATNHHMEVVLNKFKNKPEGV